MSARFSATALVVPFENLRMTDVEVVGGKNASLGEMISQLPHGVRVPGGFAWLSSSGEPDPTQPVQLWITCRMTHVFALASLRGSGDSDLVDHGLESLWGPLRDPVNGGWYSSVDAVDPAKPKKAGWWSKK